MSNQMSYARNSSHPRSVRRNSQTSGNENPRSDIRGLQFYASPSSMNSPDSGHYLGSSRDMGPPPSFHSDFPAPRPIEIEVNSSRTLPNPSASSFAPWENFPAPGFGGIPEYGPGRPLPLDTQVRTNAPDPLQQWYTGNDGPWIPKGISTVPEERSQSRARAGNRIPMSYGNQYRQPNPSDAGSLHYGVPPSDSGYGTRHSDGNASIFSADINDRDQDCQSLVGHVADYQPFQGLNDAVIQHRGSRSSEHCPPVPSSSPSNASTLVCPTCRKTVKTRSELKKHDLRHRKPFVCSIPGCSRTDGFSTTNDLDRHTKSKHASALAQSAATKRYRCHVPGCKSKEKSWPRLDNFRSHLKRVHAEALHNEEDFEDMIRRAEFWERSSPAITQEGPLSQDSSFSNVSRTHGPTTHSAPAKDRNMEPNWKHMSIYRQVFEPIRDMPAPKDTILKEPIDAPTPGSNAPASTVQVQETVQPQDVFRPRHAPLADISNQPPPLEIVHLVPVGKTESAIRIADRATPQPQPAVQPPKAYAQTKAVKPKDESASDATITEAIITALAGAEGHESVKDCSLHQDFQQRNLPHKQSSGGSWTTSPHSSKSSMERLSDCANNTGDSAAREDAKSLQQKKAREVLKTLHDLGYIVQKNPSHSPKPKNPGSAASNKSDNLVTCQTCKRFTGRPCELKKHMKRHSRPYGCTFLNCNKTFGSKNDWKRHENSQHSHLETWRCDTKKVDGGACAKVCYRKQSFQDHLKKDHEISNPEALKINADECRIGRNCQARFWCGFCTKLIDLTKKGVEAWTERFDHIDDHFMGRRNFAKQGIQDWIPVDGDKPKGDVESPVDLSPKDSNEDSSSSGSDHSPEASGATENPPPAINGEKTGKRGRSSSDDDGRAPKRPKIPQRVETVVYCCQCDAPGNPKLDQQCSVCESSHMFCDSCKRESKLVGQDESPGS